MNSYDRQMVKRLHQQGYRMAGGHQRLQPQPNRQDWLTCRQHQHRGRDWIVRAALVGWWLLATSIVPPTAPLLFILFWWALMAASAVIIWRGYKHLTRPAYQHGTKADPTPLPYRYRVADRIYWHGYRVGGPTLQEVIEAGEADAEAEWEHRTRV